MLMPSPRVGSWAFLHSPPPIGTLSEGQESRASLPSDAPATSSGQCPPDHPLCATEDGWLIGSNGPAANGRPQQANGLCSFCGMNGGGGDAGIGWSVSKKENGQSPDGRPGRSPSSLPQPPTPLALSLCLAGSSPPLPPPQGSMVQHAPSRHSQAESLAASSSVAGEGGPLPLSHGACRDRAQGGGQAAQQAM